MYIRKSKCLIRKENHIEKYRHFELVHDLKEFYPEVVVKELVNLKKLTNRKIEEIVNKIPEDLLTSKHKEFIIKYLKTRRDILLDMMN